MPFYKAHIESIQTALEEILGNIPGISLNKKLINTSVNNPILSSDLDIDQVDQRHGIEIPLQTSSGQNWQLIVLVRANGEPRLIRESCAWLISTINRLNKQNLYPVVAATYITKRAAQICKEMNVGYIDLSGNCRLAFDSIFIEREGFQNKKAEKRPLRSLFSVKSSRVIRLLLENPSKTWHLQEIATEAQISLGMVSKVKQKLLNLDFAIVTGAGIKLKDPEAVLMEWARNYSYRDNEFLACYAPGHLSELESTLFKYCEQKKIKCALTLFSAAQRIAPFVRGISQSAMYIETDLKQVAIDLGWKPVPSGANFLLLKPFDDFILHNTQTNSDWFIPLVSNIQLYLDLASYKGRGMEAAEFLLEQKIKPQLEGWGEKLAV